MKPLKSKRWWLPIAAVVAIAMGTSVALDVGAQAAKGSQAAKKEEEGKRQAPDIDQMTGKRLNEAIEFLNAEKFQDAKAVLQKLNRDRLSPYEISRVEQMFASISNAENDYEGARKHLEAAVASGGLNDEEIQQAKFQIAQLYIVQERWKEGLNALNQWFTTATNPNSSAYYLLAVCYYQINDHKAALTPAQKAVDMAESPQTSWLELLLALRLENEQYAEAVPLLERLVAQHPERKTYWIQLSGVTRQLERYDYALAALQTAYYGGMLESESDLRTLSELQVFRDIPFRGAKLLDKLIETKVMQSDEKNNDRLSQAWTAAREYEKAIPPLEKAAAQHNNGDLFVRVAQLRIQLEDWEGASNALRKALEKGGLRDAGSTQLLMGISLYNLKKNNEAVTWFERARNDAKVRNQAEGWIRHIKQDQAA
jgi:tetratricopeptide (TPR) repeat protein